MFVIMVLGLMGEIRNQIGKVACGLHETGYLMSYDPDAHDGRGDMRVAVSKQKALRFESHQDAYTCYRQQSKKQPLREDGKPNRPLTAFTVEILPLED